MPARNDLDRCSVLTTQPTEVVQRPLKPAGPTLVMWGVSFPFHAACSSPSWHGIMLRLAFARGSYGMTRCVDDLGRCCARQRRSHGEHIMTGLVAAVLVQCGRVECAAQAWQGPSCVWLVLPQQPHTCTHTHTHSHARVRACVHTCLRTHAYHRTPCG